jgi:hypothetical protein
MVMFLPCTICAVEETSPLTRETSQTPLSRRGAPAVRCCGVCYVAYCSSLACLMVAGGTSDMEIIITQLTVRLWKRGSVVAHRSYNHVYGRRTGVTRVPLLSSYHTTLLLMIKFIVYYKNQEGVNPLNRNNDGHSIDCFWSWTLYTTPASWLQGDVIPVQVDVLF